VAAVAAEGAAPNAAFMTVVALVATTTLLAGATYLLIGVLRLGRLVRYVPYPVVGGFVAGTGWLLVAGGVTLMSGVTPSSRYLLDLVADGTPQRWLPGAAFAVTVVVVGRVSRHPLLFPGLIVVATAAFYGVVALSGESLAVWRAAGYLLGPFPEADLLRPIDAADLAFVDWGAVAGQGAGAASVVFVALMAILFNATAIELAMDGRTDLDRELRTTGLVNLVTGSFGGTLVYQALSLTMLSHRLGVARRATTLVAVAVVAGTLVAGASLLELLPTLVVGGVLVYLGLGFLIDWVYTSAFTLSRHEYAVVIVILATVMVVGYLPGIGLGLLLAVGAFIVAYSRVDIVRHAFSAASATSRLAWGAADRAAIASRAARSYVLQLQGYLFFGTAFALTDRVARRAAEPTPLDHVIIDFRHVSGFDATTEAALASLARLGDRQGFSVMASAPPPALARRIAAAGDGPLRSLTLFPSLDAAVEWCERAHLAHALAQAPTSTAAASPVSTGGRLSDLTPLLGRLEPMTLPAGHTVLQQGDRGDAMVIVVEGQVSAYHDDPGRPPIRLETVSGDNLVGEIGLYLERPRSASVITDTLSTVYRITREDLEGLDPRSAATLHRFVACRLAARVAHLQRVVSALQR
jgi:sulfate permease, SulP family